MKDVLYRENAMEKSHEMSETEMLYEIENMIFNSSSSWEWTKNHVNSNFIYSILKKFGEIIIDFGKGCLNIMVDNTLMISIKFSSSNVKNFYILRDKIDEETELRNEKIRIETELKNEKFRIETESRKQRKYKTDLRVLLNNMSFIEKIAIEDK